MEHSVRNGKSCALDSDEAEALLDSSSREKIVIQNGNTSTSSNGKTKTSKDQISQTATPLHLRALRGTLYLGTKALDIAYIPLFIYRAFEKRNKVTRVTDPILKIPALELTKKIRRKEISCKAVIEAYINRIKEVNPLLNAVIDERFAEAIKEAKEVDELVSGKDFLKDEDKIEQEYPLLGVPLTVKGSIAVKGLKYTSGTVTRKELVAEEDADNVALARKAGAIPLLVSNVPELCMSWETTNKLIGTTRNPHDTTRTCGGSSGGEASLLGSGASLIGVGSDVAGSLRLPAHYCGVWGHKATPGVVSFEGHYPCCLQKDRWTSVFTLGPMARYAADLRLLLKVITLPEKRPSLDLNRKIDLKNIKIYYSEFEDFYWQQPNLNCRAAVQKVVDHFRTICDIKPVKADFYLSQHSPDLAALDILTIKDIDDIFDGNANGVWSELFRYTTFRSQHTFMAICCGFLRKIATRVSEKRRHRIKSFLAKMREEFVEMLGDNGVFVVPTFSTEAPKHGDVLRIALHSGFLSIFNALEFPVTNCPVGVTKDGLPIGVQIASVPYGDNVTLTVAEEIEKAFGGWIEPSGV